MAYQPTSLRPNGTCYRCAKKKTGKNPCKCGRPTKMTPHVLEQLEIAFKLGSGKQEACDYAGISHNTLNLYEKKHPQFSEEIRKWRQNQTLLARTVVHKDMKNGDGLTARWWLERRVKEEFSTRNETTGADGSDVRITIQAAGIKPGIVAKAIEAKGGKNG